PYTASEYAHMKISDFHRAAMDWVVLRVDTGQLDPSKFGPDNYELDSVLKDDPDLLGHTDWSAVDPLTSLNLSSQVAYHGPIPASAISLPVSEAQEFSYITNPSAAQFIGALNRSRYKTL